jgi:hypothetical protein
MVSATVSHATQRPLLLPRPPPLPWGIVRLPDTARSEMQGTLHVAL